MSPAGKFLVIAYDIVCSRRRNRLVKLLKQYGRRVNYSVFECRIKKQDIRPLQGKILDIIDSREDSVLYYPLCRSCIEHREEVGFRRNRKRKSDTLII